MGRKITGEQEARTYLRAARAAGQTPEEYMRGSFDALSGAVRRLGLDPVDGHLYFVPQQAARVGQLLARLKLGSAHAVDAFVVATAAQFPASIIATGDAADIRRLAAADRRIRVLAL